MVHHFIYPFASILNPKLISFYYKTLNLAAECAAGKQSYKCANWCHNKHIDCQYFFSSSAFSSIVHSFNSKPSSFSSGSLHHHLCFHFQQMISCYSTYKLNYGITCYFLYPLVPREMWKRCLFCYLRLTPFVLCMYFQWNLDLSIIPSLPSTQQFYFLDFILRKH